MSRDTVDYETAVSAEQAGWPVRGSQVGVPPAQYRALLTRIRAAAISGRLGPGFDQMRHVSEADIERLVQHNTDADGFCYVEGLQMWEDQSGR